MDFNMHALIALTRRTLRNAYAQTGLLQKTEKLLFFLLSETILKIQDSQFRNWLLDSENVLTYERFMFLAQRLNIIYSLGATWGQLGGNCATHLLSFQNIVPPTRLIWHYKPLRPMWHALTFLSHNILASAGVPKIDSF